MTRAPIELQAHVTRIRQKPQIGNAPTKPPTLVPFGLDRRSINRAILMQEQVLQPRDAAKRSSPTQSIARNEGRAKVAIRRTSFTHRSFRPGDGRGQRAEKETHPSSLMPASKPSGSAKKREPPPGEGNNTGGQDHPCSHQAQTVPENRSD